MSKKKRIDIGYSWEKRSRLYGQSPLGVLPKFLPMVLIRYLDNWMYSQVRQVIVKDTKVKILDLGCGYGRLALKIVVGYPNVYITGVDISQKYVELFNRSILERGQAINGDIRKLPFTNGSYDIVIAVTTLMYMLNLKDQKKAIGEIFRLLKKNGKFVIIERNPIAHSLITLGGLVTFLRGQKSREIESVGYTANYMSTLIHDFGGEVEKFSAIPFWTIFLPLELVLSFFEPIVKKFLQVIEILDSRFGSFLTPSLYISYTGKKK